MSCTPNCTHPTTAQAHCGSCHVTFGGVYAFGRHRVAGRCLDPFDMGLARDEAGVWRRFVDADARRRLPSRTGAAT